uniref:Peptidase M20 domain-containing protein 2 n=1 Tax=Schizophyllum commune (strain H4-8 / FGSC 9210) TaxID=578458 RepID=D8Q864_SCHCM
MSLWRPDDTTRATAALPGTADGVWRSDILDAIEETIAGMDEELRALSLDIHDHPELMFEEHRTHDVLTAFFEKKGFTVTRHHILETGWQAVWEHGEGGRTIGVNCEMDALRGIGHACGHNLIAIAGVAVACAVKAALQQFDIKGKVVVLGTPAEEGGGGKVIMLKHGAYKGMSACLMCHPAPGPKGSVSLTSCLAIQHVEVSISGTREYCSFFAAYPPFFCGILPLSAPLFQLKPTYRVHGVFEGRDWAENGEFIPSYAKYTVAMRTPTLAELQPLVDRVIPCLKAAAMAAGVQYKINTLGATFDLRQNTALGADVADTVRRRYGAIDYEYGIKSASTDFGNVTYALPALHPGFAIPTNPGGGNHTPEFTAAAATPEAHAACLDVSKALALTGVRVVADEVFERKVSWNGGRDVVLAYAASQREDAAG